MPKRTNTSSILIGAALALPSPASGKQPRRTHPHRFQVDGWVSSCWPGTDGFAAECEATKQVAGYTLRLAVGDDQFFQFIEHAGCQEQFNNIFRDELFEPPEVERRWVIKVFERMAHDMAKECPSLPPLARRAFQNPPNLNSANEDDVR